MKSQSIEDYLKAIYQIQEEQQGAPVATTTLAARLDIASASVTGMLKRLAVAEPRMIEYERYRGVSLTAEGMKAALEIIRHHRLVESYLHQMLGYSWDEVHAEAERLEHVISEEMEERMAAVMGHPLADPHGDPIPDREGRLHLPDYHSLAESPAGQPVEIRRVVDQEPDLLRYLNDEGLVLYARLEVEYRAPFDGPVSVRRLDMAQAPLALGRSLAQKILVTPVAEGEE